MAEKTFTGGCLCGAVRFSAAGRPTHVNLCHCAMCRRAGGAPVVAWATFPWAKVKFKGKPAWRKSSRLAERAFCRRCGSALCWRGFKNYDLVDLTVGTFDRPGDPALEPADHLWMAGRVKWLHIRDRLPRYRTDRKSPRVGA